MTRLQPITHITFDCYGTLIDWESGILLTFEHLLARHGLSAPPETILSHFVRHEAQLEAQPWRPYRAILKETCRLIAAEFGVSLGEAEQHALAESIGQWEPFPDTVPALELLQTRFRLVILSNVDDSLFRLTALKLKARFEKVITAEQVRSYKPNEAHFREALRRLKVLPAQILHVAQSQYHDHTPAKHLGFQTAWVNRPSRLKDSGLAPVVKVETDLQVQSLQELADLLVSG